MKKKLLIVKVDGIGDYILFRNFIKPIAESTLYHSFEIYMLCHFSWIELARHLDSKYIQEFISFDTEKYRKDLWYKYSLEANLNRYSFDTIIQPTYSRNFLVDCLINCIHAENKIAYDGDLNNISLEQKSISDKFYTKLIALNDIYLFEFYRNKLFCEQLLGKILDSGRTEIILKEFIEPPFDNYVVFVIGAGHKKRKWSLDNYIETAKHLHSLGYSVVLCGHNNELADTVYFENFFGKQYINLVGKTSLIDMLSIFRKSKFIVSNDTGLAHMSIALKKQTFILSNGNHFGRFVPYPKEYEQYVQCIFPFEYQANFSDFCARYYKNSDLGINLINTCKLLNLFPKNVIVNHNENVYDNFNSELITENLSLRFSQQLNLLYGQIIDLNVDILIYGHGVTGKIIHALIPEKIIGFVDRKSNLISKKIIKGKVYSPKNLPNMKYSKIIISVLGRETEIIKYLVEDLHINKEKIVRISL